MRKLSLSFFGLAVLIAAIAAPAFAFPSGPAVLSVGPVVRADYYYEHHPYRTCAVGFRVHSKTWVIRRSRI
jgi:hypothetical protein